MVKSFKKFNENIDTSKEYYVIGYFPNEKAVFLEKVVSIEQHSSISNISRIRTDKKFPLGWVATSTSNREILLKNNTINSFYNDNTWTLFDNLEKASKVYNECYEHIASKLKDELRTIKNQIGALEDKKDTVFAKYNI